MSVIRTVCSNCADLLLSTDTAVHLSSKILNSSLPSDNIGSEKEIYKNKISEEQIHLKRRIHYKTGFG